MADPSEIERNSHIESCPVVQTNVSWPAPVDQRLDELLEKFVAFSAGEISRSKLLAAIVAATPSTGSELQKLVKRYRALTAGDVVLQEAGPITLRPRRPGRRPRRS
jgi:hypothetical protein